MRHNNIGGIMLSSLDMDDFTGMFCTGDLYPLLNTIHKQLLAPLPKRPRLRTNHRRKHVEVGITRTPTSTTARSIFSTTFPTTDLLVEFVYETTTGLPPPPIPPLPSSSSSSPSSSSSSLSLSSSTSTSTLTTTFKTIKGNVKRNEFQQHAKANVIGKTHYQTSTGNQNIQKKENQKQTATSAYFESLASFGNRPIVGVESMDGNGNNKQISRVSSTQLDTAAVNQIEKSTQMFTTETIKVVNDSQEKELKNFLKNAAELPSHSLINGIMKLLGNNGQSNSRRSHLEVQNFLTSTEATTFETTTEAIIRTHVNEPDIVIPDMRILPTVHTNRQHHMNREIGSVRKPLQRFIDTHREILSEQSRRQEMRIPPIRNDLTARVIQPQNVNKRPAIYNKEVKTESVRPKELVPPPFPLPDMKEARASKSFLDMKDLGFLA